MQLIDGTVVLSAGDLTGFAACAHLTQLELAVTRGERTRPERDDPLLDVFSRRGGEHEEQQLEGLRAAGRTVVEITTDSSTADGLRRAEAGTLVAMRDGADVIYQATFFDGRWRGHADFLLRVDRPSDLGAWSYEVADAKLARRVKAAAILQMCCYSEHVARLQGLVPEHVHVLTGDGERHELRLADYSAYYRSIKARLEELVNGAPVGTYPDPVEHCSICRWSLECAGRRRADDHLSLVAGMRHDQTRKLVDFGVRTRGGLAALVVGSSVPGIGDPSLERLRHQAELQVRGEGVAPPLYELLVPEAPEDLDAPWPKRGWAMLPDPSPGDLFFDMEGDPYAIDGGLEYLFGVVDIVDGAPRYRAFWAHDRAEERQAFEAFLDLATDLAAQFPDMHVYHYASYEPSAIKRLMGAHGTREHAVDELLRGERFVDLYAAVRQSVRVGTESYSLKQVEKLYMSRAPGPVMDAGSSIVAYERYLESHDPVTLTEIQDYNRDDCLSALGLRVWLENRRVDAEKLFGAIPRPTLHDGMASEALTAHEAELAALADALTEGLPVLREERDDAQQARWVLAELLDWHRREAKPDWWAFYNRLGLSDEELVDDRESIAGLELVGKVGIDKHSTVYRYAFEPQDHKFHVGSDVFDRDAMRPAGEVVGLDDTEGVVDLKRGPSLADAAHPRSLVPPQPLPIRVLENAIARVARWVLAHGIDAPGPYRAARDLLVRRPPHLEGLGAGAPIAAAGEAGLDAARRVVRVVDGSYLAIQGPPGSGKTFTGAHMIVDLVDAGKRVGVTAHSHAAIGNLLDEVCRVAAERGVGVCPIQKSEDHQRCSADTVQVVDTNRAVDDALADGAVNVVAGTAWLWARELMEGAVDVLFVDEAGQKSLADVVAVSGAARNLVLLGDPQQLAQPSKGSHPDGAELSALEHLLRGESTIRPEMGIFLGTTYRMHPKVCAFVSEIAYDNRLRSEPGLQHQAVDGEAGLRFVPVEHDGNRSASPEEVARVVSLVAELVGTTWTDKHGTTRALTLDDVLIVTPYNAQVARLVQALPGGARVGTVDKFQGREAPVTVYSMATSSAEDVPRTMEFLYDLHRLNVAVSRARARSIIVCSPDLLRADCHTPEQLQLANGLCRFVELAVTSMFA